MQYRREIDGLRAIAVIPVILFHAGFSLFSGGFVGVDIFFVISGFLITTILISDLESGKFSFSKFYERRARRILPALFVVLLACMPLAYIWMLPSQIKDFAASAVTSVLAISNIYFLSQVSYFSPDSELQPLLHTWSLGVEEQYYFIFPVSLMLLWKFGRNRAFQIICMLFVMSFLFSEWGWRQNPARSFFFTFSRMWEIGAGSIAAFASVGKVRGSNNFLSGFGLALILLSIFAFDSGTPFPSFYSLAPVVGTVLVLLYGSKDTRVGRLLSTQPLVSIGLISYSAYLWHQPLFAFARIRSLSEPKSLVMIVLVVCTFALSYVTWRWVELPFRNKGSFQVLSRKRFFAVASSVASVILAIGFATYLGNGMTWRFDKDL